MMAAEAKIYAAFGSGTLAVGCFKITEPKVWCIAIRELLEPWPIGSIVPNNALSIDKSEMILSFPTENQMIAVLAAFTNQSFEVVDNKWKAAQDKDEAVKEAQ